jgi:anti-sigma B factor antagonist
VPQDSLATGAAAASLYAPPPPFACTWKAGGSSASWVHVSGDLDLMTAPKLAATLREAQLDVRMVVVDLRELTFIDSAGIHVILAAADEARQQGGRLVLVRGPAQIDRVFTLTGASEQVTIFNLDRDPTEPG